MNVTLTLYRLAHPGSTCAELAETIRLLDHAINVAIAYEDSAAAELLDEQRERLWPRYEAAAEFVQAMSMG